MDTDTLVEVLPNLVTLAAPIAQAGAEQYFTNRQLESQRAHEATVAERRADGLERMAALADDEGDDDGGQDAHDAGPVESRASDVPGGAAGAAAGGLAAGAAVGAAAASRRGTVYDELARIERDASACEFCRRAARALQDEPLDRAEQGAAELQAYMDRMETLRDADVSEAEAQASMQELTAQWEVLPDVFAEMV